MYVCICKAVTDRQIHHAIAQGAASVRALRHQLGVTSECGKCGRCVYRLVRESCSDNAPSLTAQSTLSMATT